MLFRTLLLKFSKPAKLYCIHGYKNQIQPRITSTLGTPIFVRRKTTSSSATTDSTTPPTTTPSPSPAQSPSKRTRRSREVSTMFGLREFLSHPLTWERNNGYFNILLGMAIFGYLFCTACRIEGNDNVSNEMNKKK